MTSSTFIPRFKEYDYPSDENYKHIIKCEIRYSGRMFECKECVYVWNHWYGTNDPFNERKGAD